MNLFFFCVVPFWCFPNNSPSVLGVVQFLSTDSFSFLQISVTVSPFLARPYKDNALQPSIEWCLFFPPFP